MPIPVCSVGATGRELSFSTGTDVISSFDISISVSPIYKPNTFVIIAVGAGGAGGGASGPGYGYGGGGGSGAVGTFGPFTTNSTITGIAARSISGAASATGSDGGSTTFVVDGVTYTAAGGAGGGSQNSAGRNGINAPNSATGADGAAGGGGASVSTYQVGGTASSNGDANKLIPGNGAAAAGSGGGNGGGVSSTKSLANAGTSTIGPSATRKINSIGQTITVGGGGSPNSTASVGSSATRFGQGGNGARRPISNAAGGSGGAGHIRIICTVSPNLLTY